MYRVIYLRQLIYGTVLFLSLLLSYWASVREAVINPDAICYLQSAQTIPMGWHVVTNLCDQAKWPFYSLLIFYTSHLTHLSVLSAAYVLNAFFSLVTVFAFILITQYLKNIPRLLWFAAFVILLAHEFNSVRGDIIRDHGFWAFYLLSILLLLHFFANRMWSFALGWSISLCIATLFRIEALVFLIALPWSLLFYPAENWRSRYMAFLKLNTITLCGLLVCVLWFLFHSTMSFEQLGRLNEIPFQSLHGIKLIVHHLQVDSLVIDQMLNKYAFHEAPLIVMITLMVWYQINVIESLSLIYFVLIIYAWIKKLFNVENSARYVLWSYILINVLVTVVFLLENMFLSKRYLVALSLTLMLWLPFVLDHFYQQWPERKWPFILCVFLIVSSGVGGIFHWGYSKKYMSDAGHWLEHNISEDAKLYCNNYQVSYYSQHFGNDIFKKKFEFCEPEHMTPDQWQQYDYVAVQKKKGQTLALLESLGKKIQDFNNGRDEVLIYKMH